MLVSSDCSPEPNMRFVLQFTANCPALNHRLSFHLYGFQRLHINPF